MAMKENMFSRCGLDDPKNGFDFTVSENRQYAIITFYENTCVGSKYVDSTAITKTDLLNLIKELE